MGIIKLKYILILFTALVSSAFYGQSKEKVKWQNVEVVILESKSALPQGEYDGGEFHIKTDSPINTLNDLTEKELKKIKKKAAKDYGVIVFLDINNFCGYTGGDLFYYWLTEK